MGHRRPIRMGPPRSDELSRRNSRLGTLQAISVLAAILAGVVVGWAASPPEPLASERSTEEDTVSAPSLEPEFRRLRDDLRALPQYQGTDARSHERLARELARRGDMDGAVSEYRQAIRLDPELAAAYRGLGVVLLDRHDYGEAAEVLGAAVRLRGEDAEAWYWLGRARLARRDFAGAAEALEQSLRLNPDDAETAVDLGLVRMAQGDPSGAAEVLRLAVQLKPDHAEAHHRLELVLASGSDPERVSHAADAILAILFARE